jgi:hypothetical protein
MRLILLALLGFASVQASTIADDRDDKASEPICATDFESRDELGLYDRLQRDKLVTVVDDEGVDGSKAIKVTYRGNKDGSQRIVDTFRLAKPLDEATLVFDVKFDEDFQFVKGGKLHGLGPDNRVTGGHKVKPDGWSARAMWHADGLKTYVYCQDKENKYGQGPDESLHFQFKKQRYYSVCIYVKLNDPVNQSNGVARIYVNGKVVAEDRDIQFRAEGGDHTRITHLLFSTFHGGDSKSWAPKDEDGNFVDVHAYFDNFAVYEGEHVRKKPGQP